MYNNVRQKFAKSKLTKCGVYRRTYYQKDSYTNTKIYLLPWELGIGEEYIIPSLADQPSEGSLVVLEVGSL